MTALAFTFNGKVTSNNGIARRVGRRVITSPQGSRDKQTVYQLAHAAAARVNWDPLLSATQTYAVTIVAYNSRLDVDNACKVFLDGMVGAIYMDDAAVSELTVQKRRDLGEERYEISIEPRPALEKSKAPRKFQYADLDCDAIEWIARGYGGFLERPGFLPMSSFDVPQIWRARARKAFAAREHGLTALPL